MRGLLSEVRLTLAEGNKLIVSADSRFKGLNLQPSDAKAAAPAKPFDIKDYQVTLKKDSNTISQLKKVNYDIVVIMIRCYHQ